MWLYGQLQICIKVVLGIILPQKLWSLAVNACKIRVSPLLLARFFSVSL